MTLAGEIAVVTGAARGMGADIARALAEDGAAVAVTGRRLASAIAVAEDITSRGGKAVAIACDVGDRASIERALAEVREKLGAPTILINNAGIIAPLGDFHDADHEDWTTNIVVNLVGSAAAAQCVLPDMLAAGRGTIVNISSGAAHRPIAGWGAYSVAKAGLAMLSQILAAEYENRGIRVFGFAPGLVDTDMQADIRAAGVGPTAGLSPEQLTPPDEPARAVAYLCSTAADRFLGQELDIRAPDFRAAAGLPALPS